MNLQNFYKFILWKWVYIMNKKKVIIIISIVVILIIALILIGLFSGGYMATILPQINDEMIEEANKKEQENRLAEKEQFAQDHVNQAGSSTEEYSTDSEDTQFKEEAIAQENFKNEVRNIMNRYYEDFDATTEQMEAENSGIQQIDIEQGLSEASIHFYDMILTVLENEDLSKEDRDTLIELIRSLKDYIEKDESLNARAETILQQ